MKSKIAKTNLAIHLFAAGHAVTVLLFALMGVSDDIPLTILTILMVITVARVYEFPLDISAALALLSCFAGFYLGTKGAEIMGRLLSPDLSVVSNVITTFVVSEILGWTTYFIVRKRGK